MPNMAGEHTLYTLQQLKDTLQEKFDFETLPYLDTLSWLPSTDAGATEKLQIGTCDEEKVFATFDINRTGIYQLRIIKELSNRDIIEVAKKDMRSVDYLEPFSFWMARTENSQKIAQRLRTYLKACFVLRGHAADKGVIIDMYWFPRVVSVIETKRKRYEQQVHGSEEEAPTVHTSRVTTRGNQNRVLSSRRPSPPHASQDVIPTRRIDGSDGYTYASTKPIPRAQAAREASSDTSEAMEDDILDLDDGTASNPRGWNSVNKSVTMIRDGKFGMFSGSSLGNRRHQTQAATRRYPARTIRSASTTIRPEKVLYDTACEASEDTEPFTTHQQFATVPPSTVIAADALETSPLASAQPAGKTPKSRPAVSAGRSPSTSAGVRDTAETTTPNSPVISGSLFAKRTTPDTSDNLLAFAKLTDAGRVCLAKSVFQPPSQETCHEYVAVINAIGASQEHMDAHDKWIAQHKARMMVLEEEIATITTTADDQENQITHKLTGINEVLSSSVTLSDMAAYVAALNKATDQAKAAQAEIAQVKTEHTARTSGLRNDIEDLEKQVQAELKGKERAQKEETSATTRKRELEEEGGPGLAFVIGRELGRASKKRRVE